MEKIHDFKAFIYIIQLGSGGGGGVGALCSMHIGGSRRSHIKNTINDFCRSSISITAQVYTFAVQHVPFRYEVIFYSSL